LKVAMFVDVFSQKLIEKQMFCLILFLFRVEHNVGLCVVWDFETINFQVATISI